MPDQTTYRLSDRSTASTPAPVDGWATPNGWYVSGRWRKIDACKALRFVSGMGLKDAKHIADALQRPTGHPLTEAEVIALRGLGLDLEPVPAVVEPPASSPHHALAADLERLAHSLIDEGRGGEAWTVAEAARVLRTGKVTL